MKTLRQSIPSVIVCKSGVGNGSDGERASAWGRGKRGGGSEVAGYCLYC